MPEASTDPSVRPPRTRARLSGWLWTGIQVVLTILVSWFIIDRIGVDLSDLSSLRFSGWEIRPAYLILSVLALALGYGVSAALWGRMVRELGGPRLSTARAIRLFLVANLGRYIPGKVVQLAGLTVLASREGVRPGTAAVAAILGQAIALLGAALIGLAAFFQQGSEVRIYGLIGMGAVLVFLLVGSLPAARGLLALVWRKFEKADGDAEPPSALTDPTFVWRWTAYYSLNWALYATAFWLLFLGLMGWATFLEVGPAFAAAYLVGYLAIFSIAGLGVRESLLAALLSTVLEPEAAVALALVARIWTTVVEVVPAAVMAPRTIRRARNPHA